MPGLEYIFFRVLRVFRRLPINPLSIGNQKGFFLDYFKGFDKVPAVRRVFGEKTTHILTHLKVEFTWLNGYMFVDGSDGHLVISKGYFNRGDKTDIYLDLIHELCHVKQFMAGHELFDPSYDYVDRPTEIEAYKYAVCEARRLGFDKERIMCYLKTEWMSNHDLKKLANNIDLEKTG